MNVSDKEISTFAQLSTSQQYATLLNLCSVEQPENLTDEIIRDKKLIEVLIAYETRKHIFPHFYNGGTQDVSEELVAEINQGFQRYVGRFHPDSNLGVLLGVFNQGLGGTESNEFLSGLDGSSQRQYRLLKKSFDPEQINPLERVVSKLSKVKNNPVILGDQNSDSQLNGAVVVVKPTIKQDNYVDFNGLLVLRGTGGARLAGIVEKEYLQMGVKGRFEIFDQSVSKTDIASLAGAKPDYVFLSVPADRSFPYALATASMLREAVPDAAIIMGGNLLVLQMDVFLNWMNKMNC